ncbi:MAG TPA: M4 family metallopeptidase, partial [Ilumatobacteraceae bacterium]|nr:M4 family metallopeptidase [Ilumatobacteraceae bacterium]
RQMVGKVPLYGSLVSVELDEDNNLVSLSSSIGEPQGVDPVAKIAPARAVEVVAARPGSRKLDGVVPGLHYYFDEKGSRWRLVYILENVPVAEPRTRRKGDHEPPHFLDYVVDAHTGKLVIELPRTPSVARGMNRARDGRGVMRSFRVAKDGAGWVLSDGQLNVHTFQFAFGDPVIDAAKLPGTRIGRPPRWNPAAVSAHANAVAVAEYLREVLFRNGIDNKGGPIISTVDCVVAGESERPNEWLNAYWDPDLRQMVYGQALLGDGFRSLSVNIDIVAHEIFHGVTDSTSRLEYAMQPGALNESYSDIFGVLIANATEPDVRQWNWELGEGLLEDGLPFRDLADPARFRQPAHMRNFRRLPNTWPGDWGGVHINSGIHNKAAHLMLTARAARRPVLTPDEVAAVFYLALTQHLSRTSQFVDSRRAVVTSARTLFRKRTTRTRDRKLAAIEQAFDDVGIRA